MKYVSLDTDFISKAYLSEGNDSHRLIDLVMKFADCEFYCHEKIVEELSRHGIEGLNLSPYFYSYQRFCNQAGQKTYGVWKAGAVPRRTKVPFSQILDDIYDDSLEALGTGDLKYK